MKRKNGTLAPRKHFHHSPTIEVIWRNPAVSISNISPESCQSFDFLIYVSLGLEKIQKAGGRLRKKKRFGETQQASNSLKSRAAFILDSTWFRSHRVRVVPRKSNWSLLFSSFVNHPASSTEAKYIAAMADSPGSPLSSIASDELTEDIKVDKDEHSPSTSTMPPSKRRRTGIASWDQHTPISSVHDDNVPTSPSTSISSDTDGDIPNSPSLVALIGGGPDDEQGTDQVSICRWDGCDAGDLRNMDALVQHIHHDHIGTRQKKYSCEWVDCSRKGQTHASGYALRAHMRSHTREKPFYCALPGISLALHEDNCHRQYLISGRVRQSVTEASLAQMRSRSICEPFTKPKPSDPPTPFLRTKPQLVPAQRRRRRTKCSVSS
jgi:hypothetical protein